MNILVTGAKGMLGTDVVDILQKKHVVRGLDVNELDITDIFKTMNIIKEAAPDVVINCAAFTNVDGCETEQEQAYLVNAIGARNLAVACHEAGAALVHISTDYVFSGKGTRPYREDDLTGPESVYGLSKLAGEIHVRNHCSRHYIIRTSWLFGNHGNNFVKTIMRLSKEKKLLTIVDDQMGSPTYSYDLAQAISELIERPVFGTYHITNSGVCTWYQFTKDILKVAGIHNIEVSPITTEELNRPAPRPKYSVLDNFNWRIQGFEGLRHYKDALKEYFDKEQLD